MVVSMMHLNCGKDTTKSVISQFKSELLGQDERSWHDDFI